MKYVTTILSAALLTAASTIAMAQGGGAGGAGGAGAGGGGGGAAAAGGGTSGGGGGNGSGGVGGDLNPHRIGRGADDNPSMPGANPALGNTAAAPSERYGGGMRTRGVSGREDPRWNGHTRRY